MLADKRTKIVCTIGPASGSEEKLTELVKAGMNVCRLNFSHGTLADHAKLIKRIRAVAKRTGEPLAILQDLQGPKIRVGDLPEQGVDLEVGKTITFTNGTPKIPEKLPVTYTHLWKDVKAGQTILLDDGLLSVRVNVVKGKDVICEVVNGGTLTSHKGMNLPETQTSIPALSEKDREDAAFGVAHGVDWIALSFVRSPEDLKELRELIGDVGIKIIAKIEKPEAVERLEEIVAASDGIMVARGDLGIEIPAEQVPLVQKRVIRLCLAAAKPVIVATQMLDSMIRNPRPTRAEVSDVANAVIDHADATMLSGETATGAYPVEAVETMARIIRETEASAEDDVRSDVRENVGADSALTNVASALAKSSHAKAILVATLSGNAARLISRERPELTIYAATPDERVLRQLNLSWAVRPFHLPACKHLGELIERGIEYLQKQKAVRTGDGVIVVAGEPLGESGHVNFIEQRTI